MSENDDSDLVDDGVVPPLSAEEEETANSPSDDKASQEAAQFASGKPEDELALEARQNEHGRTERFRDHFEKLVKHGLTMAFWTAAAIAAVWAWHLVAPPCLRWLSEEDLKHLQSLIAGGVLASLASEHFRKRLS